MLNIDEIKLKIDNGEKVSTNKKDVDGNEIYLGDHLININYSPLTYQIRIRGDKFVQHTGGSYSELTELSAKKCRINNNIKLKYDNLFNNKLI